MQSIAQSTIIKPPVEPAEQQINITIERLTWGSEKAREYYHAFGSRTIAIKRLNVILKNPQYQVFGLRNDRHKPLGYISVITTMGDETLIIHHAEEIISKSLNKVSMMMLLDHVGCRYAMTVDGTSDNFDFRKRMGFKLIENNWMVSCKPYEKLPVDKRIVDISGLETLNDIQHEQLTRLVRHTIWREGQTDPFGREIFREVLPESVIERGRTSQYKTLVWMDGGDILGVAQLQYAQWGEIILSGVGVDGCHTGKRIGRNLIAAAIQKAGLSHEHLMATTFADNVPMNHLLGTLLNWESLPGSIGVELVENAVSWKKSKKYLGVTAGHGAPVYKGD